MDSVERREIRDPVANLGSIQVQFGGQSVDGHRFVECLEDFEPTVVSIRQFLDVGFDRCGHPIPLFEFNQGLVCEGHELIVAQPIDLNLEFRLDDIVVEAGLYQLIHILDVVVTARDQFEQEDILVAYSKVGRLIYDENSLEAIGNSPFRAGKGFGTEALQEYLDVNGITGVLTDVPNVGRFCNTLRRQTRSRPSKPSIQQSGLIRAG
jgi:hypothetical protein